MVKINRTKNRTIKFLILIGIIVFIDYIMDITSIFNKVVHTIVYIIFGQKIDIDIYTSLYASIAVLLSSNIDLSKKIIYSIGLVIIYIIIFTFITAYRYSDYSLYLTLIIFITMSFPILLWILTDNKENIKVCTKDNKENIKVCTKDNKENIKVGKKRKIRKRKY